MHAAPDDRAAVVLSGGASRRFGTDKSRADLDGRPLLEHVVDVVSPLVGELIVVGPWAPEGCRHVLEPERFRGPLAALAFGLAHVTAPAALVLGGDHPLLEPRLLVELLDRTAVGAAGAVGPDGPDGPDGPPQAVVPVGPSGPEPLVACYATTVVDPAERLLAAGQRSMRALLDVLQVEWMTEPEWRVLDPDGSSFLDVDHPADLERLGQLRRPGRESDPER